MWIQCPLKDRPESTAVFNTDYITQIIITGEAVGLNMVSTVAQIRIDKSEFDKFKGELKVVDYGSMPKIVRGAPL